MIPARTNLELLEHIDSQSSGKPDAMSKTKETIGLRLDATERLIERPQDSEKQKKQYSGKKKA